MKVLVIEDSNRLRKALKEGLCQSGFVVDLACDGDEGRQFIVANDYLVKPFAFEELVARIKSLVRRHHAVKKSTIKIGRLTIDTARCQASSNGEEVPLTPAEYNLLEHLVLRRGRVVSKSQLQEWLSDSYSETVSNVVEVLVSNIRKKMRPGGMNGIIRTRRGFGYYVE